MKNYIWVVVGLAVLGALLWFSFPRETPRNATPQTIQPEFLENNNVQAIPSHGQDRRDQSLEQLQKSNR